MTCPLGSTGITPLHRYYETVRPSPARRYFRPRGWSRLRLFPWHRRPDFGDKFAAALRKLPVGTWQGPIESGFGLHRVFVSKRTGGRISELDEVREVVRREWANDFRVETDEKFYQSLLNRDIVIVERPETASENKTAAQAVRP